MLPITVAKRDDRAELGPQPGLGREGNDDAESGATVGLVDFGDRYPPAAAAWWSLPQLWASGVIQLDVSVVNVAVKPIGAALGGGVSGVQWVVDAYTLVCGADLVGGGAGGPVWSHAPADGRFRRVHPGLSGLGPGPRHRRADRGPRRAGRRRSGARGFLAVADQPRLPRRSRPGPCGQRVDSGWRGDPGRRAADRRAVDRRGGVAVDLLYQPAAGRPRVVAHPPVRDHHPGCPGPAYRPARAGHGPHRAHRPGRVLHRGRLGPRPELRSSRSSTPGSARCFRCRCSACVRPAPPPAPGCWSTCFLRPDLRLQPIPAAPAGAVAACHEPGVPARHRPDRRQQPGRRADPARTRHPRGRMGGGAPHGSRLPGHARPASRLCRPAGPGADRGLVTDWVRRRPGRHRHRLRPARQRGPAQSGIASGTFTAFRQTGSVLGVALFGTLLAGLHLSTGLEVTCAIGAGLAAVVAALGHAAA